MLLKNKGPWIIAFVFVVIVAVIYVYEDRNKIAINTLEYPIYVSPINEEWIDTGESRALRVTYGEVILEIPEKYKPNQLSKKTKSVIFPLVWPGLSFLPKTEKDKYFFDVMMYPKQPHANYRQKNNIDWMLRNNYKLRQSVEYPSLLEYWNDERKKSYFFEVNYAPRIINKIFGCNSDFRESLEVIERSSFKMGDASCNLYGVISDTVVVRIRFDARLLQEGEEFHQSIDWLIASFIVNK